MKILQDLLRSVCHFGAGANVVCNDMKEGLSVKGRRAALTGAAALTLAAVIMTSTACGSRKAESPPDEEPSESSSIAEESSESEPSSSEEEEEDTSPKELAAGADRYKPIDIEQLKTLLNERAKKYQEDSAAKTPTAGNLEEWKQINSDVVGWLSIPGTNIDYPVLYTSNTDYYTHRGYYKEQSKNGVIWFDQDTKFDGNGNITSTNGVIYGHNWTNCWTPIRRNDPSDLMFAQLAAYDYEDFGKQYPYVYLKTFGGQHKYQIFTAFYTTIDFKYYFAELPDPNPINQATLTMDEMISQAIAKSKYDFGVTASAKDKIITLSTCTRVLGPGDNQCFVVMAKLVE